ncbi:anthranilate phosphoribosyltransferase [Auraticoccus cholistanensis]|uniref:anthranilate phosphoribosyltransferase n=1 Tax=Auraticoccus cholistanensis TaxID=2656650 RepID=UPI002F91B527
MTSSLPAPAHTWPDLLTAVVRGRDLDVPAARWAMTEILTGEATAVQIAGLAVALRAKGETVEELTGLADAMIEQATAVPLPGRLVDVVGSGGDRSNTVNISTMAAVVAAGAGARVAKHGNRSASSACGTADVLEELGVVLDLSPEQQARVLERAGIVFLFAPRYHSALRHTAPARRELGIATFFNFLGPLANPARPGSQAVGVADLRMADLVAGVLAGRGTSALVFHGDDGLDELTTTTESTVWLTRDGRLARTTFDPAQLGLARSRPEDLVGGDATVNARVVRDLLAGVGGPVRDIVLLNAAATLLAADGPDPDADVAEQLREPLERAARAVDSGAAAAVLERWVEATREVAAG